MSLSDEARNFNWLLNSFVDQTAGSRTPWRSPPTAC